MKKSTRGTSFSAGSLILIAIAILFIGAGAWFWMSKQGTQIQTTIHTTPTPTPTSTPTPTPTKLFHGKETYTISQGPQVNGPKITKAVIDPLDPAAGGRQVVTVSVSDKTPVQTVSLKLITDTTSQTFPLTRSSGTDTNGEWQGSWTMKDTYLYTYMMEITAQGTTDQSMVTLTMRQRK